MKAEKKLKEEGEAQLIGVTPSGYQQLGVWLQISNRAVETMHKFLSEFGMTPSARNRVSVNPQKDLFGDSNDGDSGSTPEPEKPQGAGRFFPSKKWPGNRLCP